MSPTHRRQAYLCLIFCSILSLFVVMRPPASQAQAKTFRVTMTLDVASPSDCDADPDFCSLRQAINSANKPENAGSTISFFIPESDSGYQEFGLTAAAWFISPATPLPAINNPDGGITIDGSTQTQNLGNRNIFGSEIIILGSEPISTTAGLTIRSDDNTVRNLGIANFSGTNRRGIGIEIYGSNNTIQGNYIGVSLDATGAIAKGNNEAGIVLRESAQNNVIGGDNSLQTTRFNVIAGNQDGILIDGGDNNIIEGNYIGIAVNSLGATTTIPNRGSGIQIRNFADGNRVGPLTNGSGQIYRNFIGGNEEYGIWIKDSKSNEIYGNFIGIDPLGRNKVPNVLGGILIDGPLGTPTAPTAEANIIGAPGFFTGNYIAGNNGPGLRIRGPGAVSNQVVGNYIGLGGNNRIPSGEGPNNTVGVLIENGATNNMVGTSLGFDDGQGFVGSNFIAGNDGDGVQITGRLALPSINEPSDGNVVSGNCIGMVPVSSPPLTQACNFSLENQGNGVTVSTYARDTRIGGQGNAANIIASNAGDGVRINGSNIADTVIASNVIGVSFDPVSGDFTAISPNQGDGVFVQGAVSTLIGGTTEAEGNLIGANTGNGIQLSSTISTTVQSNQVGPFFDFSGSPLARGNDLTGLRVTGALTTTVISNSLSYNQETGVWFTGSVTSTLTGNRVVSNVANGVQFDDGSTYAVVTENMVYSNTVGILLTGTAPGVPQRVRITDNSIALNTTAGIDLDPGSAGKPGNLNNANHDIDPPIIDPLALGLPAELRLRVSQDGVVSGYVITNTNQTAPPVIPAAACLNCTIQIFRPHPDMQDPDGQGFEKIAPDARPDETGFFTVSLSDTTQLPPQIILTATDEQDVFDRNTSEFAVLPITRTVLIEPDRFNEPPEIAPTGVYTYTHLVTNTGTVDDSFVVVGSSDLNWGFTIEPSESFELPAGESQPVTVTLTVPPGPGENVLAGLLHTLTLTATSATDEEVFDTATDTTTVGARIVLAVDPITSTGLTQAGQQIDFAHRITNNGNITATLTLASGTDQPVCTAPDTPAGCWNVTLSETSYTLGPGQTVQPALSVTPPEGVTSGAQAVSTIDVTVAEQPDQNTKITDTTRVTTTAAVQIFPAREADGAAGVVTTFEHTVQNISNGPVTVRLVGSSSLGYDVSFRSATSGIRLGSDNTVTLSNQEGGDLFTLLVDVSVPVEANVGQEDLLTIQVIDTVTGNVIASVQDRTLITRSTMIPRLWLPFIRSN